MKTIDLKGKQYAEVKERIKQFRSENPRGLIDPTPTFMEDGRILYKARILKDKADETSAEAVGHALGNSKGEKDFEKLETIAVGRALALLGYSADGEIASSEEMEEFEEFQEQKQEEALMAWTEKLGDATTLTELAAVWTEVPAAMKPGLLAQKNSLKERLASQALGAAPDGPEPEAETTPAPISSTPENGEAAAEAVPLTPVTKKAPSKSEQRRVAIMKGEDPAKIVEPNTDIHEGN